MHNYFKKLIYVGYMFNDIKANNCAGEENNPTGLI